MHLPMDGILWEGLIRVLAEHTKPPAGIERMSTRRRVHLIGLAWKIRADAS